MVSQICSYLKCVLSSANTYLTINDLNDKYEALSDLNDNHDKWHYKKYLQEIIDKQVPEAILVKPGSKKTHNYGHTKIRGSCC